jgi:PII-like signaling protein
VNDDCLKLTTYFGERDRTPDGLLSDELMNVYGARRVQASILLRGAEGFGRLQHLHTDRLLSLSEDLPVVSIAIDDRPRIESMLDEVLHIKRRGLITLERARLLSGGVAPLDLPYQLGEATKLTVYVGRQDRVDRTPAYLAVCDLLYRRGIAGASVLLGVDGTRYGHRSRARFIGRNADVPMMVIAVGAGPRIAGALDELSGLLHEPLITLERVRVCKRDGDLLATPHELPGTDEHGLALWQKLMVYTSDSVRPAPAAPPACVGSGASTVTTRPTATNSCRFAVTYPSARSRSTPPSGPPGRFRSSTSSRLSMAWSRVRWFRRPPR